ncbi:MAG: hypothetical protein BMS9Abin11_0108 [Gammaproteobacteria bacterium]|nr:MAG: hypothetical protein BMS9Abin11_0108 [Gammaproteobacteria bacterium]
MLHTVIKKSMDEQKGVTLYLRGGQTIAMVVSRINTDKTIEGQDHDYIVVFASDISIAAI